VDFELSDDQVALVEGIAALCEGRFDIAAVRAMEESGLDTGRWAELAETGVFSITLPEADGGLGMGWADAVVVFEQLGRFLVPGPLVGQFLAAGVVDGAADGTRVVGVVERPEPGEAAMVEHLEALDVLCVLDDAGVWAVDARSLDGVPLLAMDPLTPVRRVRSLPRGELVAGPDVATAWRIRGTVLTGALQLGLATGALELATTYAKERQQFGKPIGSFQAVKHLCSDMASRCEVIRAAVYWAACALDDPEVADPAYAASVVKVVAAHAADNGRDCVQVHGGMGFTWEVDAHLFLKRIWVLDHAFGEEHEHAEAVAASL
jgi:alkylation response protein AidB-like acyl-CoA dehydrogenase